MRTLAALAILAGLPGSPGQDDAAAPSALRRLVHHFDFEDRERVPRSMPAFFFRPEEQSNDDPLHVTFGTVALTAAEAYGGRWSLGLALDGTSVTAELATGVLPVMPGSDHQVNVAVRTDGLEHARARLAAWLWDQQTNAPIPGSRVVSDAVRSEGRWRLLSVRVPATDAPSADLVIALEALQPRDLLRLPRPDDRPIFSDLGGRVLFDELEIWLVPRIELAAHAPGAVFAGPQRPGLTVRIADLMDGAPPAELRVVDAAGRQVHAQRLEGAGRLREQAVELPDLPLGWYRVEVRVPDQGADRSAGLAPARLDLVRVASPAASGSAGPHLGILLHDVTPLAGDLLERLGTRTALAGVSADPGRPILEAGRPDPRTVAAFEAVARGTDELVLEVDPDADVPTATLARGLAIQLGPRVRGWQLGRSSDLERSPLPPAPSGITASSLGLGTPGSLTLMPWPVEVPSEGPSGAMANIVIPHHVRPDRIAELLEAWPEPRTVTLLGPPAGLYGAGDRVADLLARTLHAWRAGVERAYVEAPWRVGRDGAVPDATYPVMQRLARHLQGRRYGGVLTLGEGIEAWLLEPSGEGESALVAWTDRGEARAELALGEGVRAFDPFGNPLPLPVVDGRHQLVLTSTPQFIEGVDRELARFRVAFAVVPDRLPTEYRVHEHELRLENPWNVPINGTVYLEESAQWRATPRANPFAIPPHGSIGLPVTLVPSRSMVAGTGLLEARVELTASRPYRFRASAAIEAGLTDLELRESWRRVRNDVTGGDDLVVRLDVRNVSDRAMSLVAFVQAPGFGLRRQPIGRLDPGLSATRTFTLPEGSTRLTGGSLFVGVDEQGRSRRLTHEVRVK